MKNSNMPAFEEEINRYIAKREPLDLKAVYRRLKDKYPLVLTTTFSLENGAEDYGEDFEILCGESSAGKFQLYDCGLYIIFDVDKSDGTYTHWHPADIEDAVADIVEFMEGKCRYELFPFSQPSK